MAKIVGDTIVVNKSGTHYFLDGVEVTARQYRRRHPAREEAPTLIRNRKQTSVAMAVLPGQVPEATADANKRGVPTAFTADGQPIFESRAHRKQYMRAYGFYDRDAGYGDAAPLHHKGERRAVSPTRELLERLRDKIRVREESRLE